MIDGISDWVLLLIVCIPIAVAVFIAINNNLRGASKPDSRKDGK